MKESEKKLKYYHITSFDNHFSILKEGIKSNDKGQIFVLNNKEIIPYVVQNQLFLKDYAIFEIDNECVFGRIENDNVAEITSKHQFILNQNIIKPNDIKFLGMFRI